MDLQKKRSGSLILFSLTLLVCTSFTGSTHVSVDRHKIFKDNDPHYFVLPAVPINHLMNGKIVAFPKASFMKETLLVAGNLPDGVSLYPSGLLVISNDNLLKAGEYKIKIKTTDADRNIRKHTLKLHFISNGRPDRDATFSMKPLKDIKQYQNQDVLAEAIDRDGKIIDALQINGSLPQGTSLTHDGKIIVSNAEALQPGIETVWIVIADEHKGVTTFAVTLELKGSVVSTH